jgi:ATP-dependent protease ClpP protease subunit
MSAEEAVGYGIIDKVIQSRPADAKDGKKSP